MVWLLFRFAESKRLILFGVLVYTDDTCYFFGVHGRRQSAMTTGRHGPFNRCTRWARLHHMNRTRHKYHHYLLGRVLSGGVANFFKMENIDFDAFSLLLKVRLQEIYQFTCTIGTYAVVNFEVASCSNFRAFQKIILWWRHRPKSTIALSKNVFMFRIISHTGYFWAILL